MSAFPRTRIGELDVSRMIVGTNWFMGYSHTSQAKDDMIKRTMDRKAIADVLAVFLRAGVDGIVGTRPDAPHLQQALADASDRVGRGWVSITTPTLDLAGTAEAESANAKLLDDCAAMGAQVCMPHQCTTDAMVDRKTQSIPGMDAICAAIRQRGMTPGLSTHMPETPVYADRTGLDVETYIQIYNAAGFLMQVEVDWVHRMIWQSKKPVLTIKPMAAGRLLPLVGLAFAWSTIRDQDMVAVGAYTPDEAREDIEISLELLNRQAPQTPLQTTRSKASLQPK